jgi:hypothetical protein
LAQKKKKTPAPPRAVQAPKKRTGSNMSGGGDKRMLWGILGASAVVLVVAAVAFLTLGGSSSSASADTSVVNALKAAGCTYKTVKVHPIKPGEIHVPVGTPVQYNSFPPSGGSHFPTPAIWGFYTTAVDPRYVVHNQEHGGVILWWGPQTPAATVSALKDFYNSSPVSMFGTVYKPLGKRVAITAWTGDPKKYGSDPNYYGTAHSAVCQTFDKGAFTKFRDTYRGHGPEGIPESVNQPGT